MKISVMIANSYIDRAAVQGRYPIPGARYDKDVGAKSLEAALGNARLADELGFDWVSVSEHHFGPGIMTPNPHVFAGALTQVVKRATIALLGPIVSINNPVRLAEEIALLDQMSGGRIVAFLLRGTPNEFNTYYVLPAETRERAQEAIKLIEHALEEPQPFGWAGRYFHYPTVSVWPRPAQTPHPPIFSSGNSPESCVFAAQNHHGLAMSFIPPRLVQQAVGLYKAECERAGWQPRAEQIIYRSHAAVVATDAEVANLPPRPKLDVETDPNAAPKGLGPLSWLEQERSSAEEAAKGIEDKSSSGGQGFGLGSLQFGGTPDMLVEQIRAFHEQTGAGVLDLIFQARTPEAMRESIRLFGEEVLPRVKDIGASSPEVRTPALTA
jgi:alkanesulfonate monooxygenase SsuD/methylene tetrahydromethanopterin reductase-like flavin-dependent oxidoreductase (luciferase family)